MKEIVRLSALYGASEKNMAFAYIDCYEPNEIPHVDLKRLNEVTKESLSFPKFNEAVKTQLTKNADEVKGNTSLSKKVKIMNSTGPAAYLKLLYKNVNPTETELDIIDNISVNYELPFGVMNAVIEYTLIKCDNTLNRKYATSLAATMKKENILTAVDALNYLNNINNRYKNKKPIRTQVDEAKAPAEVQEEQPIKSKRKAEVSDDELQDILASLNKMTGGK